MLSLGRCRGKQDGEGGCQTLQHPQTTGEDWESHPEIPNMNSIISTQDLIYCFLIHILAM